MDSSATQEDLPELATNGDWRSLMARARKTHGLTQAELASKVGTSQNMISNIENGGVKSSQFVLPIADALHIPPPTWYENDDDRAWAETGRVLRARDMELFRRALSMVEGFIVAFDQRDGHGGSNEEH